ncbi:hypothetical protein [Rhizobium sp. Leaf262]|uniref:hypothetical protein n=1 Tax=Rhizobium sp. Leaf262 TaxID=1736312 RepID=UPI0007123368|nr:hypothetical protein [Rhizobium sp. Leaf262]KQO75943.1 hypothetical protein ASF29_12245 [Rhizobium sp. Leaf262]
MAHHVSPKENVPRKRLRSFFLSACSRTSNLLKKLVEGGSAAYYLSPYYPLPDDEPLTAVEEKKDHPNPSE